MTSYSQRYVAFLDILGFKALVEKSRHDSDTFNLISSVLDVIRRYADNENVKESYDVRFTHFSDSIVITSPVDQSGLFALMRSVQGLSGELAFHLVLLRGGITLGPVVHEAGKLFGPAVVAAYQADQSGLPPRIVMDSVVTESAIDYRERSLLDELLEIDHFDLTVIANPLYFSCRPYRSKALHNEDWLAEQIGVLSTDMALSPSARAKWRWMQTFWNRTVAKWGHAEA